MPPEDDFEPLDDFEPIQDDFVQEKTKRSLFESTVRKGQIFAGNMFNTAGAGLPEFASQKLLGRPLSPKPESAADYLAAGAGTLGGLVSPGGAPVKAGKMAATAVRSLGSRATKGIGRFAVQNIAAPAAAGAANLAISDITKPKEILPKAVAGGLGGAVAGPILAGARPVTEKLGTIFKTAPQLKGKTGERLSNKLVQSFRNKRTQAISKFGDDMEVLVRKNPGKIVDLSSERDIFLQKYSEPSFKRAVDTAIQEQARLSNRTPVLKELLSGAKEAETLSLSDAQDVMNTFKRFPGLSRKFGHQMPEFSAVQDDALDIADSILDKQLGSFPEMSTVRSSFRSTMQDMKVLRSTFKEPADVIKNIGKGGPFEGPVREEASKRLFTSGQLKRIKDVGTTKRSVDTAKNIGKKAAAGAAVTGGGLLTYKLFGRR